MTEFRKRAFCLLINASSGNWFSRWRSKGRLNTLIKELSPEIISVTNRDDISSIVARISSEITDIIICGGDGTIASVIKGTLTKNIRVSVFPYGSGNDFYRNLNQSRNPADFISVLKQDECSTPDLIQINSEYSINSIGLGFDAQTNSIAYHFRWLPFGLKYFIGGLLSLFSYKTFHMNLKYDDKELEVTTPMAVFMNGKWEGGGFYLSPDSSINDGIIELLILKDINRLRLATLFIYLGLGFAPPKTVFNKLYISKSVNIQTSHKVFVHRDGEIVDKTNLLKLSVYKGAYKLSS